MLFTWVKVNYHSLSGLSKDLMKITFEFEDIDLGMNDIMDQIDKIQKEEAQTGFFQEDIEEGIGLAQSMAIHEYGSETRNIPERPAMRLSFDNNLSDIKDFLFEVAGNAVFDQTITITDVFQTTGDLYKSFFQNGIISKSLSLEPNDPKTIARKGSDTPLVDKSRLINGIHTKVVKK